MERYIQGQQPEQISMVPFCLDDFIGEENPVRFIQEFVEHLDLKALGFQRTRTFGTDRKPYSPRFSSSCICMAISIASAPPGCWKENAGATSS